ncbi:C80 family cysteine peptidase [Lysobacter antibioticus]|uniref:C80 family cysteine peptidase n=1 Tax=Lysobacter antibioticus TaxID=84531 RepID=UPI0003480CC7|nr:C80 family cysteine peptidase [Lysobacter antibioticus]
MNEAISNILDGIIDANTDRSIRDGGRTRSEWYGMSPEERRVYTNEVLKRLGEMQRTTLQVLAAQYIDMQGNPASIVDRLAELKAALAQAEKRAKDYGETPARKNYIASLKDTIYIYERQNFRDVEYAKAWDAATKLLKEAGAGGGDLDSLKTDKVAKQAALTAKIAALQAEFDKLTPTEEGYLKKRIELAAYKDLGEAKVKVGKTMVGKDGYYARFLNNDKDVPDPMKLPMGDDKDAPLNATLLLMEERPGYIRMNIALVDDDFNNTPKGSTQKDVYLGEDGKIVIQNRGSEGAAVINFSFGTDSRSLAWQQKYRIDVPSLTLAPIRSVLVKTEFVKQYFGDYMVSEKSRRPAMQVEISEDGRTLKLTNVDRKVPNQIGIEVGLGSPFQDVVNANADLSSFQTYALEDYRNSYYNKDRHGEFKNINQLADKIGLGGRQYLLEYTDKDGKRQGATPFIMDDGGHLTANQTKELYESSLDFFEKFDDLKNGIAEDQAWYKDPVTRKQFEDALARTLDRNHMTPAGLLSEVDRISESRRDINGNSYNKSTWERNFADGYMDSPAIKGMMSDLSKKLAGRLVWLSEQIHSADTGKKKTWRLSLWEKIIDNAVYVRTDLLTIRNRMPELWGQIYKEFDSAEKARIAAENEKITERNNKKIADWEALPPDKRGAAPNLQPLQQYQAKDVRDQINEKVLLTVLSGADAVDGLTTDPVLRDKIKVEFGGTGIDSLRTQLFFHVLRPLTHHLDGLNDNLKTALGVTKTAPPNNHKFGFNDDPSVVAINNRTLSKDLYSLLNAVDDATAFDSFLFPNDKLRSRNLYVPDENSDASKYMNALDVPFTGGISGTTRDVTQYLSSTLGETLSVQQYWKFELANAALMIRNGYHSFFEAIYVAARFEPKAADSKGPALLQLFDDLKTKASGGAMLTHELYTGVMAELLPVVNEGAAGAQVFVPPVYERSPDLSVFDTSFPRSGSRPSQVPGVTGTWSIPGAQRGFRDSDTRYERQIIVQLENDPDAAEAAARLAAKHPDNSVIVQLAANGDYRILQLGANGQFQVVTGDVDLLKTDSPMRWQVVGHGRGADDARTMGGMSAQGLAEHLADFQRKLSADRGVIGLPARISLVGCSLESNTAQEGFGYRFVSALKEPSVEVSIHTSDLAIDRNGRKQPGAPGGQIASAMDDNKVVYQWRWEGNVVQNRAAPKPILLLGPDRINVAELIKNIRGSSRPLSDLSAEERKALIRFFPDAAGTGLNEKGLTDTLKKEADYDRLLATIERTALVHLGSKGQGQIGLGVGALDSVGADPAVRDTMRKELAAKGTIKVDGVDVSLALLFDLGATIDGSPLTPALATALGASITGKKIAFDPVGLARMMAEVPSQADLEKLAAVVKKQLSANGATIDSLLRSAPLTDARADDMLVVLRDKPAAALEVEVAKKAKELFGEQASVRANWLSLAEGLDAAQRELVQKLYNTASEASGFDLVKYNKLQAERPDLSSVEILQRMALDTVRKRLRNDDNASSTLQLAQWDEGDAKRFLLRSGVATQDVSGKFDLNIVNFNGFIKNASAMDRIRVSMAMLKLPPDVYAETREEINSRGDQNAKRFIDSVDGERNKPVDVDQGGWSDSVGSALDVYEVLNSVQQLVRSWDQMSNTDKGFTLTELVGGIAMSPLSSGIAKALNQLGKVVGKAAGTLGKIASVIDAGVLDLALAPVTFTSIGMQWKSFWSDNGDKNSFEYKSLVANTVITTVTTAVSAALTGVAIASSLGFIAASSVLGTIAASAGPIGVAVAVAGFIISGIVQGAMAVAEYDEYFADTGAKVEAFFAAWVGVETLGMKRAKAEKDAQTDADKVEASLNSEWEKTKTYLSDLFSKDGYKTMNYRDREHKVYHGTFRTRSTPGGQTDMPWGDKPDPSVFSHVLQDRPDYGAMETRESDRLSKGGGVWAELGTTDKNYAAQGVADENNLFNMSGAALKSAKGGAKTDAFNLDALTEIEEIDGRDGNDTVLLDAAGTDVALKLVNSQTRLTYSGQAILLDQVTKNGNLDAAAPDVTRAVQQNVKVGGIESYIISDAGKADIEGGAGDEFFDVSGANVKVSGGAGNNTYSLNQGNQIFSSSNDVVLWNGRVDATVTMLGVPEKDTQALLIDLPAHHRDVRVRRVGNNVELSYEATAVADSRHTVSKLPRAETRTLTIKGIYDANGKLDASKAIQFLDPRGNSFSMTTLGLIDSQWLSLAMMGKSFVFTETQAATPRRVVNDTAANTYTLKKGAGSFIGEVHTGMSMQFVLEANLEDLTYSVKNDELIIATVPGKPRLELKIPGYAEALNSGVLRVALVPPKADTKAQTASGGVASPEDADSGKSTIIMVELPAAKLDASGPLKAMGDGSLMEEIERELDKVGGPLEIVSDSNNQGAEIVLQGVGTEAFTQLRVGDDLLLYQGDYSKAKKRRVKNYFSYATKPTIKDKRGSVVSVLAIAPSSYAGNNLDNTLVAGSATELAGMDGADTYVIDIASDGPTRWVIDNASTDKKLDTLHLNKAPIQWLSGFRQAGDDLEILLDVPKTGGGSPTKKTIVIKNYIIDPLARNLDLRMDGALPFRLPLVDSDAGFFLHVGSSVLVVGDGVHEVQVPRNSMMALRVLDPSSTSVLFDGAGYQMEVQGYDLKLIKDKTTIYLRDYYRNPAGVFGIPQTLIPATFKSEIQALFGRLKVPREKWVAYMHSDIDTEAELKEIAVLNQEDPSSNATDFQALPSGDFAVYLKTPPGSGERVLFATGGGGSNGFKLYIDSDGYLCYKAYVTEGGKDGVEYTLYSESARISNQRNAPVARPSDSEFVLQFNGSTLTVVANGANGRTITNDIRLDLSSDNRLNFGQTRLASSTLKHDANPIRKMKEGTVANAQVDSIFWSSGHTWGANPSNIELYYRANGFSAAKATAAVSAGLTSVADVGTTCLAFKASEGRLSEDFIIAYAKQHQSWLHVDGGLEFAEALEAMGYAPDFILDAYKYGLSAQDIAAYSLLDNDLPDENRLADFALALYAKTKPYLMINAGPVGILNSNDQALLTTLLDFLEVPAWDRPRLFHGVAGNATAAHMQQLAVLIGSTYASDEEKKRDLQSWLVRGSGGDMSVMHRFVPGSVDKAGDEKLLKLVLIYKGFLAGRAEFLAKKMVDAQVLDYEAVEGLLNAGVSDPAQLKHLAQAGVDGYDLLDANAQRLQYEGSGRRDGLIKVSASLPMVTGTPAQTDAYYAREILGIDRDGNVYKMGTDLNNLVLKSANGTPLPGPMPDTSQWQFIHPGEVLSVGGVVPNGYLGDDDPVIWLWKAGFVDKGVKLSAATETGFGRSTDENLVDGSAHSGEAFSWRAANSTEVIKKVENGEVKEEVRIKDLSLEQTDSIASEIVHFDMQGKVLLTSLTLQTEYDRVDGSPPDIARSGVYIVEALRTDGSWVEVSKESLLWTPVPGEKKGDKVDMTVQLDPKGAAYQNYRVRRTSGNKDSDRRISGVKVQQSGQSAAQSISYRLPSGQASEDPLSSEIVAVRFDMKHKIALSTLTLKTTYNPADDKQLDTTRHGVYVVEALSADNAWVKVSTQNLVWTPKEGEKAGDKTDMTVALDTKGIPYQSYRIRGIEGSYDRDRWIDEVTFTTRQIDLVSPPAPASGGSPSPSKLSQPDEISPSASADRDAAVPSSAGWSIEKLIETMAGFDAQSGVDPGTSQGQPTKMRGAMLAPPLTHNIALL